MPASMVAKRRPREALEHAGGAEVGHRLHRRRQRVRDVVDDGAAVAARGARVAAGGDVEGDGQPRVLDGGPQRVEQRQVVVRMVDVVRAPDRLAGQGQRAEAHLGHALHLGDGALEIGGGDGGHRREPVVVGAEGLPRPLVPDAALRLGEDRVGRGPHGEALVGEDHLGVDAVARVIAQPVPRIGAGQLAQPVLALHVVHAQPVRAMPLGHAPLDAVRVGGHARQAVAVLRVDALGPEVRGLVGVAVGGDDEVLVGIVRPRGAAPAGMARGIQPPQVRAR